MTWELRFHPKALKSWRKLDGEIREKLAKSLERRLEDPIVQSDRLSGPLSHCYKIKLATRGYRLIYEPILSQNIVFVRAVGKRADLAAYLDAQGNLLDY